MKHGHFVYNNNLYNLLTELLFAIVSNKDNDPQVSLWFYDDIFSQAHFDEEPDISLEALYASRALQLRNSYDYLVLLFSGGSDSSQVLQTFLKNEIFLDEIQIFYPMKYIKGIQKTYNSDNPLGVLLEYEGAVIPQLQKLPKETKITIVDTTETFELEHFNDYTTDDPFLASSGWYNAGRYIIQNKNLTKTAEDHPNMAAITGADKPKFIYENGSLYFFFYALARAFPSETSSNYDTEMFFWTPEVPLIPIKQSHLIKQYLQNNTNILPYLKDRNFNFSFQESNVVKSIIYPDYRPELYQRKKILQIVRDNDKSPHRTNISEVPIDLLFGDKAFEAMNERYVYLDQKYQNKMATIFRNARTKYYKVGDINIS